MRLYKTFTGNPLEVACGVLMIVVGAYISSLGAGAHQHKNGLLAAGTVLTTVGGILISWIASRAYAKEQAHAEFNAQLGSLSRNLGQAAGQIGRAVNLSITEEVDASAGFAMVDQANQMVYGQVNEIAVMQGAGFDPGYLIETAQTLQEVATSLSSEQRPGDQRLASVRRELDRVTSNLQSTSGRRTYELVSVQCPFCNHTNNLRLGNLPGDTAGKRCENCQESFFTHRARTGTPFTRRPGAPGRSVEVPAVRWRFTCPECNSDLSAPSNGQSKVMACTACNAALRVTPSEQRVVADGQFVRTAGQIKGRSGARPQVTCPICRTAKNALISNGTSYFAICLDDRQLMEVEIADFRAWRSEHGVQGMPAPSVGLSDQETEAPRGRPASSLPTE